ncbi:unnamed protein product [Arabidopsis halleri]
MTNYKIAFPFFSPKNNEEQVFPFFEIWKNLSMADSRDDLAESLQNLFTSVSSMVKSELQVNEQ